MQSESFIDFLKVYGTARPPLMRYREGEVFSEWQSAFLKKTTTLLGPLPDRVDPEVEVVSSEEAEDHVRHLLRFPVSEYSALVAYLLVPKEIAPGERRPGLIVSHGHSEYGMDAMCGVRGMEDDDVARRAYGLFAVRAGYVVLVPAWWGWTGRDGHLDQVGGRDRCNVIQMAAAMYGMNVTALHIQDGQAALDVLAARSEVDPERLGGIGNSYGGRSTMWLSAFDQRIRVCVLAGCMNTFRERSLKLSSCGIQYLPGILQYGDVHEVFSLIAPRAMQLQAGAVDPLILSEDRDDIAKTVENAYCLLDAEDRFEFVCHPEGHLLRWDLAAPFFEKHL